MRGLGLLQCLQLLLCPAAGGCGDGDARQGWREEEEEEALEKSGTAEPGGNVCVNSR